MKLFINKDDEYSLNTFEVNKTIHKTSDLDSNPLKFENFLKKNRHNSIEQITDSYLATDEYEKVAPEDLVELPYGIYHYHPEDYPKSERLTTGNIRENELYLDITSLDDLNKDINLFLNSKPIYDDMKILYRRGYLLHGPPGNGKTTLIRNLTKQFRDTSHIIWCRGLPSAKFSTTLNKIPTTKFIIFEEIVGDLVNRNMDMGSFLTFMDGENTIDNCIVIATTNNPEELAANLANRPSRFDVVYNINNPTPVQAYTILSGLLNRKVEIEEIIPKDLSFAQLKEIVLLSKLYSITLNEAHKKLQVSIDAFKAGFEEKKAFGL